MGKTDDILDELKYQRTTQGKIFDKIETLTKDVNDKHLEVTKQLGLINTKVEVHKVKSGLLGVIGGAIPTGIALSILFIKEYFKSKIGG